MQDSDECILSLHAETVHGLFAAETPSMDESPHSSGRAVRSAISLFASSEAKPKGKFLQAGGFQ